MDRSCTYNRWLTAEHNNFFSRSHKRVSQGERQYMTKPEAIWPPADENVKTVFHLMNGNTHSLSFSEKQAGCSWVWEGEGIFCDLSLQN